MDGRDARRDGTIDLVRGVGSPKLKIVESTWNPKLSSGGNVLAQQHVALFNCTGDWAIYLQSDEAIHERDHALLLDLSRDRVGSGHSYNGMVHVNIRNGRRGRFSLGSVGFLRPKVHRICGSSQLRCGIRLRTSGLTLTFASPVERRRGRVLGQQSTRRVGSTLVSAMQRLMATCRSTTDRNTPRLRRWRVSLAKKTSSQTCRMIEKARTFTADRESFRSHFGDVS
jgi:hypothetical protein